jgi:hypothetical protein
MDAMLMDDDDSDLLLLHNFLQRNLAMLVEGVLLGESVR